MCAVDINYSSVSVLRRDYERFRGDTQGGFLEVAWGGKLSFPVSALPMSNEIRTHQRNWETSWKPCTCCAGWAGRTRCAFNSSFMQRRQQSGMNSCILSVDVVVAFLRLLILYSMYPFTLCFYDFPCHDLEILFAASPWRKSLNTKHTLSTVSFLFWLNKLDLTCFF